MHSVPPSKPLGPRTQLQRSQSGSSPAHSPSLGETPGHLAPVYPLPPAPLLTRASSAATGSRPSLTLNVSSGGGAYSNPFIPSHASLSPEVRAGRAEPPAPAPVMANTFSQSPNLNVGGSGPHGEERTAMPITPRSISKVVSLNDLQRLVRRMETHMPSPTPLQGGGSSSYGDDSVWSDGVLMVVEHLGEGASGAVEAVQDTRTGRRLARKTIITHEGPLKQLARELAFLSGLRHMNIVRFYGAYMSPSNSEVKLVMELCEGRSLAAIGEQIRRRSGRVGEKVARVLAEGVRPLFYPARVCWCLTFDFPLPLSSLGPAGSRVLAFQEGHPPRHQTVQRSPLATGRRQGVRLWSLGRAHRLARGYFHRDDQVHGGACARRGRPHPRDIPRTPLAHAGSYFLSQPERITGTEYTIRADVWSTGLSILELVQNRFPFPSDLAPVDLIMHITTSEVGY